MTVLARGAGGLEDERADRQRVQPPAQGLQAPPVRLAKSAGVDVHVATHVEDAPTSPLPPRPDRRVPAGPLVPSPRRADAAQRPPAPRPRRLPPEGPRRPGRGPGGNVRMLTLPPAVRVFIATEPADMRRSFDTLDLLAARRAGHPPGPVLGPPLRLPQPLGRPAEDPLLGPERLLPLVQAARGGRLPVADGEGRERGAGHVGSVDDPRGHRPGEREAREALRAPPPGRSIHLIAWHATCFIM